MQSRRHAPSALWRTIRVALFVCVVVLGMAREGYGQEASVTRTAGTVANLFQTLDPPRAVEAVRLSVPADWRVEAVELLRYGTERVPVQLQRTSTTEVVVRAGRLLRGPHELVLRVRLPEATGRQTWAVGPAAASGDAASSLQPRRQQVSVEAAHAPDGTNWAVSFEAAQGPVLLRPDELPPLSRDAPFTFEFWMRTTGLNEVVLSTWSGEEAEAYPGEFLVDRSGRLRFYVGRPGKHEALWTSTPVADGKWHHVAAVHDATQDRLRLLLDGAIVDSLSNPDLPTPVRPVPVALGGRLPSGTAEAVSGRGFSGHLDEVGIWGHARTQSQLQRPQSRPRAEGEGRRLSFEKAAGGAGSAPVVDRWPEGVRRVASTLSFEAPLRDVRARTNGRSVTLRWTAEADGASTFVVERSPDRTAFEPVGRLQSEQARRSTGGDRVEFSYTDTSVPEQVVFYRIRQERTDQPPRTTATIKVGVGTSAQDTAAVSLTGNYPNPVREATTIAYEVHEATRVSVSVWTITGTHVATLADERHAAGTYEKRFDASSLPSGPYFIRLQTPSTTQSERMVVVR